MSIITAIVRMTDRVISYLSHAIPDISYTFEQLRSSPHGHDIRLLIYSLADNSRNPLIIAALMYGLSMVTLSSK